jgi:hypothetical protein
VWFTARPVQGGPTASSQSRLAKDASVFKSSEVTVGFAIAIVAEGICEERTACPEAEVLWPIDVGVLFLRVIDIFASATH